MDIVIKAEEWNIDNLQRERRTIKNKLLNSIKWFKDLKW